jgi:glycosyltransferase involved in cell wall biosynthesis
MALHFADAITAGTRQMLELCRSSGARANRCHLIAAPGVDIAKFENPLSTGFLERLEITEDTEIILSPRAIQPFYRIESIVQAFRYVHSKRPQTILLLLNFNESPIGYSQIIKRQIEEAGIDRHVRWVEALAYEQMPELYARSSVMISIPEQDAIPQSAYEAFAAGCPMVASDLASYDGVISHERTALCVPGADPGQVAEAILRILQDDNLRKRLIEGGRRVVRERGDFHHEMAKLERLYYDLMQQRR